MSAVSSNSISRRRPLPPTYQSQLARITENARRAQEQIDHLRNLPEFAEHDNSISLGPAWNVLARRQREAIIQPPKPEIVPARAVLQRSQERTAEAEHELEAG